MKEFNIIQVLLFLMIGFTLFSKFAPVKGLRTLNSHSFREELKNNNKFLIDVREPNEYQEGFILGAVNIPLSQLTSKMSKIPKNKHIFLYCQSGMRSKKAARLLIRNDFQNITHLQRGFLSWNGQVQKSKQK